MSVIYDGICVLPYALPFKKLVSGLMKIILNERFDAE